MKTKENTRVFNIGLVLVFLLLLMACEKNRYDAPEEQPVYFEYHFANFALGAYGCYKYDPEMEAYQYILLAADGDYQQYNQSSEAEKLTEWLVDLQ